MRRFLLLTILYLFASHNFVHAQPNPVLGTTLLSDSFDGMQLHPAWVQVDQNFQLANDGQLDFTKPQPWGPAIFEAGGKLTMRTTGSVPPIAPPMDDIDPLFYDWQTPLGIGAIWAPSTVDPSYSNGIFRTKLSVDGESAAGLFFRSGGPQGNYVFQAVGARDAFEFASNTTGQPGPGDDKTVRLESIPNLPVVPGTDYWVQSQVRGDKLSLTVWKDGAMQPTSPQLTITDSQVSGGWIGLAAYTHRGFTTGDVAVKAVFDDVSFTVPHDLLLEDFEDGNLDGWVPPRNLTTLGVGETIVDLSSSGELHMSADRDLDHGRGDGVLLGESRGSELYANGIIRTGVRLDAPNTNSLMFVRAQEDEGASRPSDGYFITLSDSNDVISLLDQTAPGEADVLLFAPFNVTPGVDYEVETVLDGETIKARAWVSGETPPEEYQLTFNSAATSDGGIKLSYGSGKDGSQPAVTYFDLTFEQLLPGDFDNNKLIDAADIDRLANELQQPSPRRIFDMNNDGAVTPFDHNFLVTKLAGTQLGDADLNGTVDFPDFLRLSANFGQVGGWSEGDFDGNGEVDFPDFLILSENFGGAQAAATVPEPTTSLLCMSGLTASLFFRRLWRRSRI